MAGAPHKQKRSTSHKRRAVLHIGTEKTGTTTLQAALAGNRDHLRKEGVLFPQCLGPMNHTVLVAASLDDGVYDNTKAHILANKSIDEGRLRTRLQEDLDQEIRAAGDWHTLLISSELIHSRLHTSTEIDRLLSYFRDSVDEICVVAVIRRQDKLAVSRMSTAVRAGHSNFRHLLGDISAHVFRSLPDGRSADDMIYYYDYAALLKRFTNLLGTEAAKVHLYDEGSEGLDPMLMASRYLGVDLAVRGMNNEKLNPANSAEAQYVIAALNCRFPMASADGRRNTHLRDMKKRIEVSLDGNPRTIAREEAKRFAARFDASNETVRQLYFPDRKRLFDDDFGMYPEAMDYSNLEDRMASHIEYYSSELTKAMQSKPSRSIGKRLARSAKKRWRRWSLLRNDHEGA